MRYIMFHFAAAAFKHFDEVSIASASFGNDAFDNDVFSNNAFGNDMFSNASFGNDVVVAEVVDNEKKVISNSNSSRQETKKEADTVVNKSYERKDESFHYEDEQKATGQTEAKNDQQESHQPSQQSYSIKDAFDYEEVLSTVKKNGSQQNDQKATAQTEAKNEQQVVSSQSYSTKTAAAFQHFSEAASTASSVASNQSNSKNSLSSKQRRLRKMKHPSSILPSQSFSSASTNRMSNQSSTSSKRRLRKPPSIFRRKTKDDAIVEPENNEVVRIVSPEKDHDPDIVIYPSESSMSELSLTSDIDYYQSSANEAAAHAPILSIQSTGSDISSLQSTDNNNKPIPNSPRSSPESIKRYNIASPPGRSPH